MPTPEILPDVASSYVARRCPRFAFCSPFSASTALAMISLGVVLCRLREKARSCQAAAPGGQRSRAAATGCAHLRRTGGPAERSGERGDYPQGARLPFASGLFEWLLRKEGPVLFDLDPRQYQASVDQAKADVAAAEANLTRVQADVARDTPLAAQSAIPQKQLDNDIANQASWEAQLKAKKAALDNAELNLGWTKVYSPIDGIAGVSNSQIGDLVGTATKMTTVSQVNPIWAYFNISESHFLSVAPLISDVIMGKISIKQAHSAPVEYIQANDQPYPAKGKFIYINRQVGTQTGTIQMAAEFANPDALLRPGGFGRVRFQTGTSSNAILVPQASVMQVQSMYQVLVVTPESKAVFRPVKVGDRVGTNWIITDGLKPGEKVVVDGLLKIQQFAALDPEAAKQGIPVVAKPYAPPAQAAGSN